jgi:hypothetical protein
MNRIDLARLQQLEKFVEQVNSALDTYKLMQKDPEKNSIAYRIALNNACLLNIQREIRKVKK